MDPEGTSLQAADRAEHLLEDLVALPSAERAAAFARLLLAHPDLEAELRARYDLYGRLADLEPVGLDSASGSRHFGEYELGG